MKKLLMLLLTTAFVVSSVEAKKASSLENIPVTDVGGYLTNGNFEVKHFVARDGQLWALGQLTGIVSGKHITRSLHMPVTLTAGSAAIKENSATMQVENAAECDLLNVAFGPVDVTVLGFDLQIAPVDVDLTAVDAPADILCAIISLLGTVGNVVNTIASLLNAILGGLGGLGGLA